MKQFLLFLTLILCTSSISSCTYSKRYDNLDPDWAPQNETPVGRFKTTYLAEQLHAFFKGSYSLPIAVVSFVDVDNIETTSSFGRIMTEQLLSELVMKGYKVIELRQSTDVQIVAGQGEFALSRELAKANSQYNLGGVVVGTYAQSSKKVYLNVRVLNPKNGNIISVASAEIENTKEVQELLQRTTNNEQTRTANTETMERMPINYVPIY